MINIRIHSFTACIFAASLLGLACSIHADEKKTPLAQQMGGMAKDFRALRKMINDPAQKDAAIKLVKDMEEHATKAKEFEPVKTKDIAPADKDQFLADYRKQIDGLIGDMQKLEAAVSAGNTADASTLLDKLNTDKRQGHKKFNAEDEGPGHGHAPAPATPAVSGS